MMCEAMDGTQAEIKSHFMSHLQQPRKQLYSVVPNVEVRDADRLLLQQCQEQGDVCGLAGKEVSIDSPSLALDRGAERGQISYYVLAILNESHGSPFNCKTSSERNSPRLSFLSPSP